MFFRFRKRRQPTQVQQRNRPLQRNKPSTARVMVVVALMLIGGGLAFCWDGRALVVAAQPSPSDASVTPPAGKTTHPLDEPIRLLNLAAATYQQVNDYTCTLISRERIGGQLQPQNIIQMKFRNKPFSVYMHWLGPKKMAGQQVCFVYGKNNNKMRVRSTGILGKIGFVSLALNDPRAQKQSRHSIVEAGIGNIIARCLKDWRRERAFDRSQVKIADYKFNKRPCTRVEVTALQKHPQAYCYKTVIYLDKQTTLPVRAECYDWPRPGGPPEGELLETYSYVNIRFNVGLTDKDFDY